jgi:threonine/homoserine/homoserine lactone efflux protein
MLEALLKGFTLGLLLSISVGPVMFSIIKQSLNNGYRGGLAFVLGVSVSDMILVLISNVFTELFSSLKAYKTEIGVVGSAFLISMGIYFLLFKKVKVTESGKLAFSFRKSDFAKISISGFFMNILNPAVIIFWISISTAVIIHSIQQRVVIFVTCLLVVLIADVSKVLLAGKIRNRLTPHNLHIINRVNGIILIGFGIALVWGLLIYGKRL